MERGRSGGPAAKIIAIAEATGLLLCMGLAIKAYIAERLGQTADARSLELAARLDPGNADLRLRLGSFYLYFLPDRRPEKAIEHFKLAAQLDPYDPQPWLALAAAYEDQEKTHDAEFCLRQAEYLAPNLPDVHWVIGNFFLRQGNLREAFPEFRIVLKGTGRFDQNVFNLAWKASEDPNQVLDELIPRQLSTEFSYLDFLTSKGRFAETIPVWKRIAADPGQILSRAMLRLPRRPHRSAHAR